MKPHTKSNRGIILVVVLGCMLILIVAATSFVIISNSEMRMVQRQNNSTRAFYLAEAGIQRALDDLFGDFQGDPSSPSWTDGDINGIDITQGGTIALPRDRDSAKPLDDPTQPFYPLPYASTSLGDGLYHVSLLNVPHRNDEIYLRSMGRVHDVTRSIVVLIKMIDVSIWNSAIFGGSGSAGVLINGNVNISGTVHVLGTGLQPGNYAINLSGTANIYNYYSGIPAELSTRIPPCPTIMFNGELVQSLDTYLRVKNGKVGLSGTASVGESNITGNSYKETIDGAFVTEGYGGDFGATSVYADNGTSHHYDLGDYISFPSLSAPYTDPITKTNYATYLDYLRANALVISKPAETKELANITPVSNFTYTDGTNVIAMDGAGNLTIAGIVYVQGSDVVFKKYQDEKTIIYSGSGTILAEGDNNAADGAVSIDTNLLTCSIFPTSDVLGIMTPGKLVFKAANIDVMGAFYAESAIQAQKQTDIAGTLVSNYVDMGVNVPSVFQVPALADNLPPGMIGSEKLWFLVREHWSEL
jgi:hypothetical protein